MSWPRDPLCRCAGPEHVRVSWLRHELLPAAGRLCLTHTPGAGGAGRDDDLDALVALGMDRIVCLQEPHEFEQLPRPETVVEREQAVLARGLAFVHEPIVDFGAPDLAQARRLTSRLVDWLGRGETIAMHCWAGLGRAGTIAACTLVQLGLPPREAVRVVRRQRPGAVQSADQMRFIDAFTPG